MAKNHSGIIKAILERQEEELNIAKISRYGKIDYKNTYNIIKDLEQKGLLSVRILGKTKIVVLNKKVHPLIFEAEYERREELLKKNKDFKVLYTKLSEIAILNIHSVIRLPGETLINRRSQLQSVLLNIRINSVHQWYAEFKVISVQ